MYGGVQRRKNGVARLCSEFPQTMGPIQSSEHEVCLNTAAARLCFLYPTTIALAATENTSDKPTTAVLTGSFLRFALCASPSSAVAVTDPDAALRFELILSSAIALPFGVAHFGQHWFSDSSSQAPYR